MPMSDLFNDIERVMLQGTHRLVSLHVPSVCLNVHREKKPLSFQMEQSTEV